MTLYTRVLSYLRPYPFALAAAGAAIFAFAALDASAYVLLIPFVDTLFRAGPTGGGGALSGEAGGPDLMTRVLDVTVYRLVDVEGDPLQAVQGIVVLILVVFLLKNVFDFARTYLVAWVEQTVTRDLRNEVYDHVLRLDLSFFAGTKVGQITSRITHDVEQLRRLLTTELARLLSSGFEVAALVALMLLLSWKLTLAAFVVIPGTMGVWALLVKPLRRGDRRVLDLAGEVSARIQETLSGIRVVKSSSAEEMERERFRSVTGDYHRTFLRAERLRALAGPLTETLATVGTVVILLYGARLVLSDGALSGAQFVSFIALSLKLYRPVKYAAKFPTLVQPGLAGAERVFEFLETPITIRDRPGAKVLRNPTGAITFENVTFEYRPGEPVLRDITMEIPAGSVVALVGPSGAGKSTLADLVVRFHDVTSGRVTVDGVDVRDWTVSSLRASMGIVPQETVLFHDTIAANITYGTKDATDLEIRRAARAANAHGFITALRGGYEMVVGERGTRLSGGERQRIALARAILSDRPILILDEATSALDTESERLVQEAVGRLMGGRTVLVIAHRLSTVRRADLILVLKGGRIVERGDHNSLFAASGLYRRLYELQHPEAAFPSTESEPAPRVEVRA
ncbi:MAG: ABC transporter ATP-binding protein [Gemmatimonadetes bacterium]|nr:ABC transporter ATP-binding protein [Gemmatimonadota bacterium]